MSSTERSIDKRLIATNLDLPIDLEESKVTGDVTVRHSDDPREFAQRADLSDVQEELGRPLWGLRGASRTGVKLSRRDERLWRVILFFDTPNGLFVLASLGEPARPENTVPILEITHVQVNFRPRPQGHSTPVRPSLPPVVEGVPVTVSVDGEPIECGTRHAGDVMSLEPIGLPGREGSNWVAAGARAVIESFPLEICQIALLDD